MTHLAEVTEVSNAPQAGEVTKSSFLDFVREIPLLVAQGFNISNQQKLAKLNIDRMRQGLAPFPSEYATLLQPSARVDVDPELKKMLMYGLFGIGGIILLSMVMKK
jgi:hypothetical protein